MNIESVRQRIRFRNYLITIHATLRMEKRLIEPRELEEAIIVGEIIEEYPKDKYGASCLIYGRTKEGRHLHIQCSLPPMVWVITTYEPDPKEWLDYRKRR